MFPSLDAKYERFLELEKQLQDPAVIADTDRLIEIQKEYGGLGTIAAAVAEHRQLLADIGAADEMLIELGDDDEESRQYAQAELDQLKVRQQEMESELEELAASGDTISRGGLIMELRAGTGGDEAAIFVGDLLNMYLRYIDTQKWKVETIDSSPSDMGGFKEITLSVAGEGAFHRLQFESGGHRVQRVPETESQGRIQTSMATVAVLPEATDVEVEINDEDVLVETMRAQGPGGQKVNKTESAVRMTHVPTGIAVKIQDEKSQHKNRAKAMKVLRSRLFELRQSEAQAERSEERRTLIGSGDRSQRVRTYNYPQGRVTDHRIGLTLHKLDQVLQGNLDEMINEMLEYDRRERLGLLTPASN